MNNCLPAKHSDITVEIAPGGPVTGSIRPPGSKSLTNRALICAAFADGPSKLIGALHSEDTAVMIDAMAAIGVDVKDNRSHLSIDPRRRAVPTIDDPRRTLFVANSGTTIRFLTAALSAFGGLYRLEGIDRMHERPIGDLIDAIGGVIGGSIRATSAGGCPPVTIDAAGWIGRDLSVAGAISSQFLSGLMMAAPIATAAAPVCGADFGVAATRDDSTVRIVVDGELVSRPYVDMTAKVIEAFGGRVRLDDSAGLAVSIDGRYRGTDFNIEPDASAASYFWAAAAITGGSVTVEGLDRSAVQGDVAFVDVLARMGCQVDSGDGETTVSSTGILRGVDVDMNLISDTVQTLAIVAMFADGPTRVRGVAHNRHKETDRIGNLAKELRNLGATVDEHDDGFTLHPPATPTGATLETYNDHRMAMSFSLAGLRVPGVTIRHPACTAKTYPEYWHDLETLTGRSHRWGKL